MFLEIFGCVLGALEGGNGVSPIFSLNVQNCQLCAYWTHREGKSFWIVGEMNCAGNIATTGLEAPTFPGNKVAEFIVVPVQEETTHVIVHFSNDRTIFEEVCQHAGYIREGT